MTIVETKGVINLRTYNQYTMTTNSSTKESE